MPHRICACTNFNRESQAQFEDRTKPQVYVHVRRITRSTMYEKAPLCKPELALGK